MTIPKVTETVPTQAQIEAARKLLRNSSCFSDEVCSLLPCKCIEEALTAAAGVGPSLQNLPPEEQRKAHKWMDSQLVAATIERCAQVADATGGNGYAIAAAIRALKDAPRCEWPECGCPEGSRCPGC